MHLSADGQTLESAAADGASADHSGTKDGAGDHVVFDAQSVRDSGVQSVHGAAENVVYLGVLDQVRAAGHVNAVITDPQSMTSPGSLHTDSVTVDIGSPEYVYNCSGDPTANDIDFTILEHDKPPFAAKPGANSAPETKAPRSRRPTQLRVHAYNFDNAVLQTGSAVTLTGQASHLDMSQRNVAQKDTPEEKPQEKPMNIAEFSRRTYPRRFLIQNDTLSAREQQRTPYTSCSICQLQAGFRNRPIRELHPA